MFRISDIVALGERPLQKGEVRRAREGALAIGTVTGDTGLIINRLAIRLAQAFCGRHLFRKKYSHDAACWTPSKRPAYRVSPVRSAQRVAAYET